MKPSKACIGIARTLSCNNSLTPKFSAGWEFRNLSFQLCDSPRKLEKFEFLVMWRWNIPQQSGPDQHFSATYSEWIVCPPSTLPLRLWFNWGDSMLCGCINSLKLNTVFRRRRLDDGPSNTEDRPRRPCSRTQVVSWTMIQLSSILNLLTDAKWWTWLVWVLTYRSWCNRTRDCSR